MLLNIANHLSSALQQSIAADGTEPTVVKRFVTNAGNISKNNHIKIETQFVHQKPYVFFVTPSSIFNKSKTELGYILFIVKRIQARQIVDHRFVFLQVKKMNNAERSMIDVHQFRFYRDISMLQFRFGNSVYAKANVTPLIWSGLTQSTWFGSYLFLSKIESVCARPVLIDLQYSGGCKPFKFEFQSCIHSPFYWSYCTGIQPFRCYLSRLFRFKGIGCRVTPKTAGFLDIILKRLGWALDPPEETEGYFEDDSNGGFGVIRLTINDDQNE